MIKKGVIFRLINITVLEKYKITSDQYQFILNIIEEESGKLKPIGYYSTIDGILQGLFNHNIRKSDIDNWKDLSKEIKRTNDELSKIRKELEYSKKGE